MKREKNYYMDSPKVFIVIPHYNIWELTHARLWELYKHCRDSITEVVVVDDFSTDNMTEGGLRWWAEFGVSSNFRVSSISTPKNYGFLLASNFGLKRIINTFDVDSDDIIILLSNDVEIRTNFVRQVTKIISQYPSLEGNMGFSRAVLVGGVLYTHDTGWNKFGDVIFQYLEGWLLATTAKNWKTIDYFDDRFAPSDYEDVDFSTKARLWSWELVPLNNPGLHHIGGQSIGFSPERLERTNINKKKFEQKWVQHV